MMFLYMGIRPSPEKQLTQKGASQDAEEISYIHGHDGQHAVHTFMSHHAIA